MGADIAEQKLKLKHAIYSFSFKRNNILRAINRDILGILKHILDKIPLYS